MIYRIEDLGNPKVEAAANRLRIAFPSAEIEARAIAFDANNGPALAAAHDFMIDATDDPSVKFLINDIACAVDRPFVYGGVLGMAGQAMTVLPGRSACLRCLFEAPPEPGEIASCRDAGIIGPVAGAIGEIQAAEALAYIRGATPIARRTNSYLRRDNFRALSADRRGGARRMRLRCGAAREIRRGRDRSSAVRES